MFDLSTVESNKSFSPIKPGVNIAVKLEKIELSPKGDLDFFFTGTDEAHLGSFKPRFWANNFDKSDAQYSKVNADNFNKQIRQIADAYLTPDQIKLIKGNTWEEYATSIIEAFTPESYIDVPAKMKIILKWGSDEKTVLPKYGSFISTARKPQKLSLGKNLDKNNIPWDRVLPMSHYGATATDAAPTSDMSIDDDDDIFGSGSLMDEDELAFGEFGE